MEPPDLREVRVICVDSSVVRKWSTLFRIADLVNRLRDKPGFRLRLMVPALAHAEVVAYLRREKGSDFDPASIEKGLTGKQIEIEAFDRRSADSAAAVLASHYPRHDAWRDAKIAVAAARLHLDASVFPRVWPATVDWYLAAHVAGVEHSLLVTDDGGREWSLVPGHLDSNGIIAALEDALA